MAIYLSLSWLAPTFVRICGICVDPRSSPIEPTLRDARVA
jgi:hypothetical protein